MTLFKKDGETLGPGDCEIAVPKIFALKHLYCTALNLAQVMFTKDLKKRKKLVGKVILNNDLTILCDPRF
jgi:hypothetical protein